MPELEIDARRLEALQATRAKENGAAAEVLKSYQGLVRKRREADGEANLIRVQLRSRYGEREPPEQHAAVLKSAEEKEAHCRRREADAKADYEAQNERFHAAAQLVNACSDWLASHGYEVEAAN